MKILIVSGFLGAGKTTFIKEMIEKTKKNLVILENEYGQNNIDSKELSGNGPSDLKLLEFMEGCVCCTQKDKFSNTILTISAGLDPEYLVVEPTGVGKLSNIIAAIKKVMYEKIILLNPIVVVSPRGFKDNMAEFPEIYTDQLHYAGTVVLSKIENEDINVINEVADKIHEINPSADIITEHYSRMDNAWWESLLSCEDSLDEDIAKTEEASELMSVDINLASFDGISELVIFLEDALRGTFGFIARAKGVIKVGNEWIRFDLADKMYSIVGEQSAKPKTQSVFFGKDIDKEHLMDRLNSYKNIRIQRKS